MARKNDKSNGGVPIPLYIPNIMNYVRFVAIVASWKFALTDPKIFSILYIVSQVLGAIDGTIARLLGQTSFFGSQLDILMTRFSTETLIFVVIKLSLTKILVEEERMKFAFFFSCIFLSDFISYWFQVYSAYLLDEKPHNSKNPILRFILTTLRFPLVDLVMTGLAEVYVFCSYINFFPEHFELIRTHPQFNLVLGAAVYGMILKTIHNVLHLWESSMRIVGLDVDIKNNPVPVKEKAPSKKPDSKKLKKK